MRVSRDTPFNIAVLGDFSGREQRGGGESQDRLTHRKPLQVDRDNFDSLLRLLNVHLRGLKLAVASAPVDVQFHSLDDFHPDQLFENAELFSALRKLRLRLLATESFHDAAKEVLAWGAKLSQLNVANAIGPTAPIAESISGDGLLDSILDASTPPEPTSHGPFNWDRIIHDIVAPYAAEDSLPHQAELVSCVDRAAQFLMNNLLHDSSFRALESVWRALHFLIARTETSPTLKIFLVDVTRSELATDLLHCGTHADSAVYQLLNGFSEKSLDAPWGLLVGNYEFTTAAEDVSLLERIAGVAAACGAPFLASLANNSVVEQDAEEGVRLNFRGVSTNPAWQELCRQSDSAFIGLVWPRFLLRTPYGAASQPIEAFAYEEISATDAAECLLWGDSAFLCATLAAECFAHSAWDMSLNAVYEIENLPTWIATCDDETQVHAGGEYRLSEREALQLRELGITPLLTLRDQDVVRVSAIQSLQQHTLSGHWTG